uniref:Uncharacterized protein n=1 Tax=Timema monikensis TaxID=170555 RepID=A0A7R9HL72_9NEOP|nr:unnamed protein product [Timema monikensis]
MAVELTDKPSTPTIQPSHRYEQREKCKIIKNASSLKLKGLIKEPWTIRIQPRTIQLIQSYLFFIIQSSIQGINPAAHFII